MNKNDIFKKKLFYFLRIALVVISTIAAGEILVRVLRPQLVPPHKIKQDSPKYLRSIFCRNVYKREAFTFEVAPGIETHINEKGYRGQNFEAVKPAGVTRIMCYGGSQVLDQYAPLNRDWPHLVEAKLKQRGFKNAEVINAAVSGNASFDSIGQLWSEGHHFSPDFVVLCNMWNDMKYFRESDTLLRIMEFRNTPIDPRIEYYNPVDQYLCQISKMYIFFRTLLYKRHIGMEGKKTSGPLSAKISPQSLKQYKLNLELFVDLARNIQATPILMTQPRLFVKDLPKEYRRDVRNDYQGLTYEATVMAADEADQIIFEVAEEKNVQVIDASKVMSGHPQYFVDHVHLSSAGSDKVSDIVAGHFAALLIQEK